MCYRQTITLRKDANTSPEFRQPTKHVLQTHICFNKSLNLDNPQNLALQTDSKLNITTI